MQTVCLIIPGATSSTYTLQNADDGESVDADVVASDAEGHFNAEAAPITYTITDPQQPAPSGPVVLTQPQGVQAQSAAGQPASAAPSPEASAAGNSASPGGLARLLGIREMSGHVQAQVRCEQTMPCHLSLAVFASGGGHAAIAERSLGVAPGRNASVDLALGRTGVRLIATRARLSAIAILTLRTGRRTLTLARRRMVLT